MTGKIILKGAVRAFSLVPNSVIKSSSFRSRNVGSFPFGGAASQAQALQNLFFPEGARYFATAIVKAPSHIEKHDVEDSDLLVEEVALNLQEGLQEAVKKGCEESKNFLQALDAYGRGELTAIMFSGLPKQRQKEPTTIADAIAFIAGLKRHEHWPKSIPAAGQESLPPHQDFKRTDVPKGNVKAVIFVGVYEAPDGSKVETCYIEPQKILAKLKDASPESFKTLSQRVFYYLDKRREDLGAANSFAIVDADNEEVNFPSASAKILCDKSVSNEEKDSALASLNAVVESIIENEDYAKFEIKPGCMMLINNAGLHFRRVSEEEKSNPKNISHQRLIYVSLYSLLVKDVECQPKVSACKVEEEQNELGFEL